MLQELRDDLTSYSPQRKKKAPTKKKPRKVKKYTRKKPAHTLKRKKTNTMPKDKSKKAKSKKAKSKKTKNAYMTVLSKARKENAPSFVYNSKTYKRHETDKGFVYYK
jgi:hypothetical protein